jgi:hypothetical protein
MRPHLVFALASVSLLACSSQSSRSGFEPGTPDVGSGSSGGSGSDPNLGSSSSGSGGVVDTSTFEPPKAIGCSTRPQEILCVDFRSGWWAGGGGGTFSGTALGAVVAACPDTKIDYHHFEINMHAKCVYTTSGGGGCQMLTPAVTVADIRASFEHKAIGDYTQIWVLSGSDQDQSDIPVGDQLFQGVLGDTRGACIPMLVAAGDGFITHANTVTNDLGMGTVFSMKTNPPSFFSVSPFGAEAASSIPASSFKTHVLFTGVPSVVDTVHSFIQQAHGDALAGSVPAPAIYDVIARDGAGNATIAIGASKHAGDGYRPFIFDAGWQRMYTLGKDAGTGQYLKNIVMYLSLVGCKAAPIAPPK